MEKAAYQTLINTLMTASQKIKGIENRKQKLKDLEDKMMSTMSCIKFSGVNVKKKTRTI